LGEHNLNNPRIRISRWEKRIGNSIVSYMPKSGNTYAEPFAGRANGFWKAATTLQLSNWWLNDLRTSEFFHALLSHGNTIHVPEHTRNEFELCKVGYKSGDPTSILLIPYFTYNGAGFDACYRSAKGSPTQAGYEPACEVVTPSLSRRKPRLPAMIGRRFIQNWVKMISPWMIRRTLKVAYMDMVRMTSIIKN
jgi:hypothetical protein